jgi:hypothetical protein
LTALRKTTVGVSPSIIRLQTMKVEEAGVARLLDLTLTLFCRSWRQVTNFWLEAVLVHHGLNDQRPDLLLGLRLSVTGKTALHYKRLKIACRIGREGV